MPLCTRLVPGRWRSRRAVAPQPGTGKAGASREFASGSEAAGRQVDPESYRCNPGETCVQMASLSVPGSSGGKA